MSSSGPVLVAFGGNALIPRGRDVTQGEQLGCAFEVARCLRPLAGREGLVLAHGNGPQVGDMLIRVEEAINKVPPVSLDVCVAQSQGGIGYFLEIALRTVLPDREVSALLTFVEVEGNDPALGRPSKPVGPFYSAWRAEGLMRTHNWPMIEQDQRGWRKVVPSPRPSRVLGLAAVRCLLAAGHVVIAAGGGGIPVVRDPHGALHGIEAVIDKDYTAALLARELSVARMVVLTDVDQVQRDFGTPRARPLARIPVSEGRVLMAEGQFPPGTMGPKMEAALQVAEETGREVLITSPSALERALAGETGTRVVPDESSEATT